MRVWGWDLCSCTPFSDELLLETTTIDLCFIAFFIYWCDNVVMMPSWPGLPLKKILISERLKNENECWCKNYVSWMETSLTSAFFCRHIPRACNSDHLQTNVHVLCFVTLQSFNQKHFQFCIDRNWCSLQKWETVLFVFYSTWTRRAFN